MTHETETDGLGRRGALAALLGTAAVATAAGSAQAAPTSNVRKLGGISSPSASPVTATIASEARPNYIYRTLWYGDFLPLDPSASARTFAGSGGAYAATVMEAAVEIPAGALLRDVEWYVANSSGSSATFYCAVWTPADGYITTMVPASIASGSGLTATRVFPTSGEWGPYPNGAKIILYAPANSTVVLNGVRLGFSGGLESTILATPSLVYDTTISNGKFAAGQTRTITVTGVAAGTTAAIFRVIATTATTNGTIKIFPANLVEPVYGTTTVIANAQSVADVTIPIPATRQIKIRSSLLTHLRLELVGSHR